MGSTKPELSHSDGSCIYPYCTSSSDTLTGRAGKKRGELNQSLNHSVYAYLTEWFTHLQHGLRTYFQHGSPTHSFTHFSKACLTLTHLLTITHSHSGLKIWLTTLVIWLTRSLLPKLHASYIHSLMAYLLPQSLTRSLTEFCSESLPSGMPHTLTPILYAPLTH